MNTFTRLALILGLSIFAVGCGSGSSSNKARGSSGGDSSGFDDDAAPFFNQGGDGGGAGGDGGVLPIDCSLLCGAPLVGQELADACTTANMAEAVTCPDTTLPFDCEQALQIPVTGAGICATCVAAGGMGDCGDGASPLDNVPIPDLLSAPAQRSAAAPLGDVAELGSAALILIAELDGRGQNFLREAVSGAISVLGSDGELNAENAAAEIQSVADALENYLKPIGITADEQELIAGVRNILLALVAGLTGDEETRNSIIETLKPQLESFFELIDNGGSPKSINELLSGLPVPSQDG